MSTRFTALTIREGDAFLLEDNGRNYLFDSGKNGSIVDLLKHKGIKKLDLAICSHNDADHAYGFIELLKENTEIEIKEIWLPYWWASILQYSNDNSIDWNEVESEIKKIKKSKSKNNIDPKPCFSDKHEPLTDNEFNEILSNLTKRYRNEQYAKKEEGLRRRLKSQIKGKKIRTILNNVLGKYYKKESQHLEKDFLDSQTKEIAYRICYGLNELVDEIPFGFVDKITHEIIMQIITDTEFDERSDEKINRIVYKVISMFLYRNEFNYMIRNIIIVPNFNSFLSNIRDEYISQEIANRITNMITDGFAKDLGNYLCQLIDSLPSHHSLNGTFTCSDQTLRKGCYQYFLKQDELNKTKTKNEESPEIMFDNIMDIALLAHDRNCTIKWFEPTQCKIIYNSVPESGFFEINSTLKHTIQHIKDTVVAFAMVLHLSSENKHSLVFEYFKNHIPIIRFSADSDYPCQSNFYRENIIVTAPHHGSKHNANVYGAIQGDDIIWVRSDRISSQGRPCYEFKTMKNKYCLACDKYNFVSEICFEYNPWDKHWRHVCGEQCRCKP